MQRWGPPNSHTDPMQLAIYWAMIGVPTREQEGEWALENAGHDDEEHEEISEDKKNGSGENDMLDAS